MQSNLVLQKQNKIDQHIRYTRQKKLNKNDKGNNALLK